MQPHIEREVSEHMQPSHWACYRAADIIARSITFPEDNMTVNDFVGFHYISYPRWFSVNNQRLQCVIQYEPWSSNCTRLIGTLLITLDERFRKCRTFDSKSFRLTLAANISTDDVNSRLQTLSDLKQFSFILFFTQFHSFIHLNALLIDCGAWAFPFTRFYCYHIDASNMKRYFFSARSLRRIFLLFFPFYASSIILAFEFRWVEEQSA